MSSFLLTAENVLALNMATLSFLAKPGTKFRRYGDWDIFITESADLEMGVLTAIPLTPENCLRIANGQPTEETETFNFNVSDHVMSSFHLTSKEWVSMPWHDPSSAWAEIQQKRSK